MTKYLLLGLLVVLAGVSTPARAATTDIAVEWCDLLGSIAYEIGWCYPELTVNNATAVTSNSAQVVVATDRADKGILYVHTTTSCTTAPSVATMLASQSQAVSGANNTFAISGLTPSTNGYCNWAMQEWDRRYSSIVKNASTFNTPAGASPPASDDPAQGSTAPVYYVSFSTGNDSNNGTSVSTPWKNLSKVTALNGTTSAKVYLLSGDTWTNQSVDINYSGTANDWAHFGCYKVVSSAGKICSSTDPKPSIRGPLSDTCHTNKNCPYGVATGGVSVWDDGQVTVDADYVNVQDIDVRHVIASGIQIKGAGYSSPGSTKFVRIIRPNIYHAGARGIIALNGVQKVVIRDGTVDLTGQCKAQAKSGGLESPPNCTAAGQLIVGAMPIVSSPNCDCLVENMVVTRSTGEPMNAYSRTSHVAFRGNRSGDSISKNYTDQSSHIVYESNISWGTNGNMGYPTTSNFGGGWEVNLEDSCQSVSNCSSTSFNVVKYVNRNNISFNSGSFDAGMQPFAASQGRTLEAYFFNNASFKSTDYELEIRRSPTNIPTLEVKANIFGSVAPSSGACSIVGTHNGFARNIWGGPTPVAACRSATDKYGVPTFIINRDDTFWAAINRTNHALVEAKDFMPTTASIQYRAGDPTLATRDLIDIAGFSFALSEMSYPFKPNPVVWGKARGYDFLGTLIPATNPDAGPVQYSAEGTPTPDSDSSPSQGRTGPVYYVANSNCSNSNAGTSHSAPWCTLSKVSTLTGTTSAKVYFKSGDTWTNQSLTVSWNGVPGNYGMLGCWKEVAGQPVVCDGTDTKPKITGYINQTCIDAKNCAYDVMSGGITSEWDAQVRINGNYLQIQDVAVQDSAVAGIHINNPNSTAYGSITDVIIKRVYTKNTGMSPLRVLDGAKRVVVRDSEFGYYNLCVSQAKLGGLATFPTCQANTVGWPGGVQFVRVRGDCDCLVENNFIHHGWGEGSNAYDRSHAVVFRGNRYSNILSVSNYTDTSDYIITESNIAIGMQGNSGYANSNNFGGGFVTANEGLSSRRTMRNNFTRNNICLDCGWPYSMNQFEHVRTSGGTIDSYFFHNFAASSDAISYKNEETTTATFAFELNGNVEDTTSGVAPCYNIASNAVIKNNHFGGTQPTGLCNTTSNKSGTVNLAVNRTQAEYDALDYSTINTIQFTDFIPKAGSNSIGNADQTLSTRSCFDATKFTFALSHMSYPFKPDPAKFGLCRPYDIDGTPVSPTSANIGPQEGVSP